jgi:DNA-directed RNA polymerase subunit RPC12/RpoP
MYTIRCTCKTEFQADPGEAVCPNCGKRIIVKEIPSRITPIRAAVLTEAV